MYALRRKGRKMMVLVAIVLVLLGIEDLHTQKLSLWPVIALIMLSAIYAVCSFSIMQCILGVLPGICLLILSHLQPEILGAGDALITIIYGLMFGWFYTCIWLMWSFFLAAVVGVFWKLLRKTSNIRLPFVPFMALVQIGMCL